MINTIQIPKPCHQDWGTMTPNEQGRHCMQCCKTVVDFTSKEPEEIVHYLKEHSGQNVCGRFMPAQLNTPIATEEITIHIFNSSLSYFKKIAALILITFGIVISATNKSFSQSNSTATTQTLGTPKPASIDSTIEPMMVGEVSYNPAHKPAKKPVKKPVCHKPKAPSDSIPMMGKVAIVPTLPTMGAVQVVETPDNRKLNKNKAN